MTKRKESIKKQRPYQPYQVPIKYYHDLERKASEVRRSTGADVKWTDVLKSILEANLNPNQKKD